MTSLNDKALEQDIVSDVREHGCHIAFVTDPAREIPDFAYSVGFPETVGQPEVIVFGLPREVMAFMINEAWRQCRAGLQLENGLEVSGLLDGHHCVVGVIPAPNITANYFRAAMWFHHFSTGGPLTDACQIIWPGVEDGLFPWQDGCADIVRNLQPCLFIEEEPA